MAGAKLVNLTITQRLERGDVLRLAFAQDHTTIARASAFAADMATLWERLHGMGDGAGFPITPNPALRGETASVVDFKLSRPMVLSDFLAALDVVSGYWIKTVSAEKLSATAASRAPTNAGAAERETVRQGAAKAEDESNPWNRLADGIGTTVNVVRWLALVVVIGLALFYFGPALKAGLSAARRGK